MNKNYTFLVLFLAAVFTLQASPIEDAAILQKWKNAQKTKRALEAGFPKITKPYFKEVFELTPKFFETAIADSSVTLVNDQKVEKVFYARDTETGYLTSTHYAINNEIEATPKYTINKEYNAQGKATRIALCVDPNADNFDPKDTTSYYNGDRIAETSHLIWNTPLQYWGVEMKEVNTYDADAYLVSQKFYKTDAPNQEPYACGEMKVTHEISGSKNIGYSYFYKGVGDADFSTKMVDMQYYSYDANGNETYHLYEDGSNVIAILRLFNQNNQATQVDKSILLNQKMYLIDRTIYQYDSNGNITAHASLRYKDADINQETVWVTYFYYPLLTSIETPDMASSINISINNKVLTVDSSNAETITVYSPSGTTVYTNSKDAGTFSTSIHNLPQGVILVKGSTGWVRKLIVR